jgi:hypothetical protein
MKRGRSVHTALTRAQMMPSLGTRQPPPWCPCFLPQPLLPHPPLHVCNSLTWLLSLMHRFPVHHTLIFFPFLVPRPAKPPFFRAILKSCSCLLLVHLVVMWGPSGFILFSRWANGNWGPLFHFPPVSYILQNSG